LTPYPTLSRRKQTVMAEYQRKHIPDAVYLDSNILRSAGHNLNKPWMSELLSITNQTGIVLCIPELVLREWCEHLFELITKNHQKLFSAINLLGEFEIDIPDISKSNIKLPKKHNLIKVVQEHLVNAGFKVINNFVPDITQLINEAVYKIPPFEKGGKGFCDAIIVESYIAHANGTFSNARVMVITNDDAILRSKDRFESKSINVTFARETEIGEKLKSLIDNEVASYIEERGKQLTNFILTHENTIMEFVKTTPLKITDWWLEGALTGEDRIDGTIQRILSAKPTRITDVIGGAQFYGKKPTASRYPVKIFVEIELEIEVKRSNVFGAMLEPRAIAQPQIIDKNSPLPLEPTRNWQYHDVVLKIQRSVTVEASLNEDKAKEGQFEDLNLESVS